MAWIALGCAQGGVTSAQSPDDAAARANDALVVQDGPWQEGERLIHAGAEPHVVLRYTADPSSSQRVRLTRFNRTLAAVDEQVIKAEAEPDVVMEIRARVRAERVNHHTEVFQIVESVRTLPPRETDGDGWRVQEQDLSGLTGVVLKRTATPRMELVSQEIVSQIEEPGLEAWAITTQAMLSPFELPEWPVGVGAEWEVHVAVAAQGSSTLVQRRFRVESIDGTRVRISTAQRQSGQPGQVQIGGRDTELIARETEVTGEAVLDLSRAVPLSAHVRTASEMHVRLPTAKGVYMTKSVSGFEIEQIEE